MSENRGGDDEAAGGGAPSKGVPGQGVLGDGVSGEGVSGEGSPSDPDFRPLAEAKRLLRQTRAGTLATLAAGGDPFASLVTLATDHDGSPLFLVSQLSHHTRHLDKDGRCSLQGRTLREEA